jgi:predicted peroxiredoxin
MAVVNGCNIPEDLIPELDGIVPASEFALRAMEADKVITF